jgi:hypothetical protein
MDAILVLGADCKAAREADAVAKAVSADTSGLSSGAHPQGLKGTILLGLNHPWESAQAGDEEDVQRYAVNVALWDNLKSFRDFVPDMKDAFACCLSYGPPLGACIVLGESMLVLCEMHFVLGMISVGKIGHETHHACAAMDRAQPSQNEETTAYRVQRITGQLSQAIPGVTHGI